MSVVKQTHARCYTARRQTLLVTVEFVGFLLLLLVWPALATDPMKIGGLPVTCNLTLPIACKAMAHDAKSGKVAGGAAEYAKFSGWPKLKEAFMTGRIQAAYFLAPLPMDLADKGIPVKIVALGHRSLAADIAAGAEFFKQKSEVLKFVLSSPPDRVTYGDLRVIRSEFEELSQLALEAGMISHAIPYEKYVDESFIQNVKAVEITVEK